jgi:hypothetical protein
MARRRRVHDGFTLPPLELLQWELWVTNRGLFDAWAHTYDESARPEWTRQRRAWARENGWPGGEAALLAGELPIGDESWDESEI